MASFARRSHIDHMTETRKNRPRDPNQIAKLVVDIAAGESNHDFLEPSRKSHASKAGSVGGPARAKSLTPEERSKIASIAAQSRWKKG